MMIMRKMRIQRRKQLMMMTMFVTRVDEQNSDREANSVHTSAWIDDHVHGNHLDWATAHNKHENMQTSW